MIKKLMCIQWESLFIICAIIVFLMKEKKKNVMGYSNEMLEIINEMIEPDKDKRKNS